MSDPPKTLADLSLEDLASIHQADGYLNPETHARLAAILRADPGCSDKLATLEVMAADANSADDLENGYELNQRFDLLLQTEDGDDLEAAVGFSHAEDMRYPDLIALANARASRAEEPGPILALMRRLRRAEANTILEPLQRFLQELTLLSPEGAGQAIAHLCERYEDDTGSAVVLTDEPAQESTTSGERSFSST